MTPGPTIQDGAPAAEPGRAHNEVAGPVGGGVVQAGVIGQVTLVSAPPPTAVPRQLPPPPHAHVDRDDCVRALDRLAARDRAGPAVAVLTGMRGVGKTACALHWGHRNAGLFEGGQLYADLAAYRGAGGVAVPDVVAAFLRALGVHAQYVPAAFPERVALFRSTTARLGVLVLLDDADSPAQVRALVPGSPGSVVLVTSRSRLSGLTVDGAETIEVRPLEPVAGASLLTRMVADGRAEHDQAAVRDVVRLCAGLPLALRVAGAELGRRKRWPIARYVRHIEDDRARLDRLSVEGDHLVEHIFDAAYEDLPDAARHLYRALGRHPGPDFGPGAAAAAAGTTPESAEDVLGVLCGVNLLEEWAPDRYRFHELVRLHARARSDREEPPAARVAAERRVVGWYLLGAAAADRAVLGASRWRLAEHDLSRWAPHRDAATGMAWFEAERANLLAAVRLAADLGAHVEVWQFCEALWALYHSRKHYEDWIEAHRLGVAAAVRLGDRDAESRMRNQLARAHVERHEFDEARAELDRAALVAPGRERGRALLAESYGLLHRERGLHQDAVDAFRAAQEGNRRLGDRRGDGLQGYQLGDALVRAGRAAEALPVLRRASALLVDLRDEMAAARVHIALGRAYEALRRYADARQVLTEAVTTTRDRDQPVKEAQALEVLVGVAERDRDQVLFRDSAERLYQLYRAAGSPRSDDVRRWIARGRR
ncbi:NB-ARC domain-containing protein [Saccharothrix sp. Mg75]|uniref:NB-ARC domain-containing protein n=1 Tax=Saccharothrix sp. Mg75 TaxID=3445357 RepID=UPI003EEA73A5